MDISQYLKRHRRILAGVILFIVIFWWCGRASYIELMIPVKSPKHDEDFWWEEHRTTLSYADELGVLRVLKYVGTYYTDYGWKTQDEVVTYFDTYITEREWIRAAIYPGGDPALPESNFVVEVGGEFREYIREGDPWGYSGRICFAVWPIGSNVSGFHIAVATVNPSFINELANSFD